jgi:glycosyltransferase involved in cell wall biosynthesis
MPEKQNNKVKICIIASQISGFGKIGGFGSMTRKLAESLAESGYEVSVMVPIKKGQQPIEQDAGFLLYGISFKNLLKFKTIIRKINADIYHSQNPNLFTYLALKAEPSKKHIITCRDPRDTKDWLIEMRFATWKRRLKTPFVYLFEDGPFISRAVRKAHAVGCPAHFLKEKVARMYKREDAILLPNIEDFPKVIPQKSDTPLVCFVGRLDKRKRPELIFALAAQFPDVRFLVAGKAEDQMQQAALEKMAAKCPNVEMLGYQDKFKSGKLRELYDKSWILLNTSAREGLPMTFIEAAGHGCAILGTVNPDNFSSEFGYFAETPKDLEQGLKALLEDENWRKSGELGFRYVCDTYNKEVALKTHFDVYRELLFK